MKGMAIGLPRHVLMDRCPNPKCRALGPSSCYCPSLPLDNIKPRSDACPQARNPKHYHRECWECGQAWIVYSADPIRSLARLAANRSVIAWAVGEVKAACTPEKAAGILAKLPVGVALDLLRRTAEASGGWSPELNKVGLLLLKPGAPVGEEVSA